MCLFVCLCPRGALLSKIKFKTNIFIKSLRFTSFQCSLSAAVVAFFLLAVRMFYNKYFCCFILLLLFPVNNENKKKTKQSIFIDLVVEDFNTKQKLICQGL